MVSPRRDLACPSAAMPVTDRAEVQPRAASLWFRVLLPGGALGPGKIALLRRIGEVGSVSAAARAMRMSHARSVKLVAELNALGSRPLVNTRTGGDAGGGATVTDAGHKVIALYDRLEKRIDAGARDILELLAAEVDRG